MGMHFYIPKSPLSRFVELLWLAEGAIPGHSKERVLPTGTVEMVSNLKDDPLRVCRGICTDEFETFSEAVVCGTHAEFFVIDASQQASLVGVHFKPGGAFAFDAKLTVCLKSPGGGIMHAEIKVGDSMIMLAGCIGHYPPVPSHIHLYVEDCDEWYRNALAAGATSMMEPMDQFYGDRSAGVKDSQGIHWWMATHKEDVSTEELEKRARMFKQ